MKTVYFEKDIPRILATKLAAGHAKRLLSTGINAVKYEKDLPEPALPADDWVRVKISPAAFAARTSVFIRQRPVRPPRSNRSPARSGLSSGMKMSA